MPKIAILADLGAVLFGPAQSPPKISHHCAGGGGVLHSHPDWRDQPTSPLALTSMFDYSLTRFPKFLALRPENFWRSPAWTRGKWTNPSWCTLPHIEPSPLWGLRSWKCFRFPWLQRERIEPCALGGVPGGGKLQPLKHGDAHSFWGADTLNTRISLQGEWPSGSARLSHLR